MKIRLRRALIICAFLYIGLLITSCSHERGKVDVSTIDGSFSFRHFDQDLFSLDTNNMGSSLAQLRSKYGNFFDLFAYRITSLGSQDSILTRDKFRQFITDTNFRAVYRDIQKEFGDGESLKKELSEAFRYYRYYFPGKQVPEVITLLSAFSFPVVADSNHLGIGLDMYLGTSYRYYSTIEPPLPLYLRLRMTREYAAIDALRGWLQSDYMVDESQAKMIEMMISQGKIIYALDLLFPETPDSLKIGYTGAQLNWCKENESKVWSFFVDQQLLFSTDPNLLMKYVNDAPTTNGFPKESPGNIGQFIGWKIVQSYMDHHPDISLQQLMENKDLQKVFQESKYKPAR